MALFTPWGTQQNPTPFRSGLAQIPGLQGLGNLISNVGVLGPGTEAISPTWSQLSTLVTNPRQGKATETSPYTNDLYAGQNMSVNPNAPGPMSIAPTSPTNPPSTGLSGGNGGQVTNKKPIPQVPQPGAPDTGMFDSIINPILQSLEGGIGVAQGAYDANLANLNAQAQQQTGKAQANTQENVNALNQRQTQTENTAANSINEARRQFSELAQGINSRYGQVTGTGAFAEGILGGQTQRNIAGYRQQLAQNVQNIQDTLGHVKLVGQQALQDIENTKQAALKEAKFKLDETIQNIRYKQGELQSKKAEMIQGAIQNYQSALQQAQNLDYQFKTQLYTQQQAAEQKLAYALATQKQAATNLKTVSYSPWENIGVFNPKTGSFNQVASGDMGSYDPSLVTKKPEEQTQGPDASLYGQLDNLFTEQQ